MSAPHKRSVVDSLYLRLPWPPSINKYWRRTAKYGGTTHISRKGREYRALVGEYINADGAPTLGTQRLSAILTCYPPDRRRRDLDNLLKPLLDALEHAGVFQDDSQIDRLFIERASPERGGAVAVSIAAITS